jgi:small redox-active disulfide protein 2
MVTKIRVGKFIAGIVGLNEALSEAAAANLPPDEAAARSIFDRVRQSNYVAPGAESEYLEALLREYRKHLGQRVAEPTAEGVDVKVLGPGCPNCEKLEQLVRKLMAMEQVAGSLEHVRDIKEISSYGILATPGLVINGRVRCAGRVPSEQQLLEWLREAEREVRPASSSQV